MENLLNNQLEIPIELPDYPSIYLLIQKYKLNKEQKVAFIILIVTLIKKFLSTLDFNDEFKSRIENIYKRL